MPAKSSENPGISPSAPAGASALPAVVAAPVSAPVPVATVPVPAVAPPVKAPAAKGKVIAPPPAPPPPDTRTPAELESIAMDFLAAGALPASAAAPLIPTEAAPLDPGAPITPTPAEEPLEVVPDPNAAAAPDEGTAGDTPPPVHAGPEWLKAHLDKVPDDVLEPAIKARVLKQAQIDADRNAELRTLKAELASTKDAVAKTPPVIAQATVNDPLAHVTTEAQLQQTLETARNTDALADQWIEWCTDNKEGGTPPGATEEFTPEQVKAQLAEARGYARAAKATLAAAPAKETWLKTYQATAAAVVKVMPELGDKTSPEYGTAVELLSKPLASRADHMQIVADYLAGKQAREFKAQGGQVVKLAGNGHHKVPEPAKPTTAATAAVPVPGPAPAAPLRAAGAPVDITALQQRSKAGDQAASNKLAEAFIEVLK